MKQLVLGFPNTQIPTRLLILLCNSFPGSAFHCLTLSVQQGGTLPSPCSLPHLSFWSQMSLSRIHQTFQVPVCSLSRTWPLLMEVCLCKEGNWRNPDMFPKTVPWNSFCQLKISKRNKHRGTVAISNIRLCDETD